MNAQIWKKWLKIFSKRVRTSGSSPDTHRWAQFDVSQEKWEANYSRGRWEYLKQLDELSRYSVVVGYCQWFRPGGSILDVGCGEGILQQRLGPKGYSRYVGIDISSVAIERASRLEDSQTAFICADVTEYLPTELFDTIVFNEVLYYVKNPLALLKSYEKCLRPDGMFVISMWVGDELKFNWNTLESEYSFTDGTITQHQRSGLSWICKVWNAAGA